MNKIENWENYKNLDIELKTELLNYTEDEKKESFYQDLDFGTGGIRSKLGPGTNRLNIYTVRKITEGFAKYIISNTDNLKIVVAYDNRKNSFKFALEIGKVFAKYKIQTFIFEALRPTPELSFAVRHLNAFGGIVITASHNPKEYNGYKIYDQNGCQVTNAAADKIKNEINKIDNELDITIASYKEFNKYISIIGSDIDEAYYEKLASVQYCSEIDKNDFKVVFTPQHGASNIPLRTILDRLGYHVIPVLEQTFPDQNFVNTKSPNPENAVAFELASKYAKDNDADIMISTDPDSDRLGIGVKHNNDYVLLTGNQTGAIILDYILNFYKENNETNNLIVFDTIVTSSLGRQIAKKYGVNLKSTLTGFKYIGEQIELNKDKKFVFGYEESYGYLIKDFARDKDALQSSIIICEIANYYKKKNLTLVDVLNNIYEKYGYYLDKIENRVYEGISGQEKINKIMDYFRSNKTCLNDALTIKDVEDYQIGKTLNGQILDLPKSNVLKFIFEDDSWITIRPSGTEPKCKFYYCINDNNQKSAEDKYKLISDYINEIIEKIG